MVYRAAIIGCGKIGSEFADDPRIKDIYTHAGAYVKCPDTELVAVCDKDTKKAEKCRERWNVTDCYQDYQKMIYEVKPDIVSICTPDTTHFDIIHTILTSSKVKVIFAEKPLALDIKEAENLVSLAEKKGAILAVNYFRRYSEKILELRDLLHSDTFGDIQTINGYYTKGTMHNGTHFFDLARFFVGEIVQVKSFDHLHEKNNDPTLDAYIKFANGSSGYLHACDATKFSIFEMDIIGSNGRVYIKESGHVAEVYQVTDSPYYSGYKSLLLSEKYTEILKDTILHVVEDIVQCLRTGQTPRCSGHDGVAALRIALAVIKSADTGSVIELGV